MKRNSLFLFLSMMFVWVGLCSAKLVVISMFSLTDVFSMVCLREFGLMKVPR